VKTVCYAESGKPLFIRFLGFAKVEADVLSAAVPESRCFQTGHAHQSDFARMLIVFVAFAYLLMRRLLHRG
jgi:hypothetical protein